MHNYASFTRMHNDSPNNHGITPRFTSMHSNALTSTYATQCIDRGCAETPPSLPSPSPLARNLG